MAFALRTLARTATRYTPLVIRSAPAPRLSAAATLRPFTRAFTSTPLARGHGLVDQDLSHKLSEEIQYERDNAEPTEPEFLTEFRKNSPFKIEERPGYDEVALTRSFGNEKIQVLFSISDINDAEDVEEFAEEGEAEAEAPETESSFPVRCSITIEKDNKGALTIDAVAQDGIFMIENILFYKDNRLATEQTAEADWQRRGLYIGPQFAHLDPNVQVMFERFLEERGVNTALALFIPSYVELKEQKEYVAWLENVKTFVDA
ncbi:uncharacterized protein VTP21DRAFT_5284 [Calcarisporiella thermophila]|uniref:uncharacterized protein n=1 Tax=Calcarisporiella thermophila TaxID=911321 RepID=UPI003743CAE9